MYLTYLFKRHLILTLAFAVMFIWGITVSAIAIKKDEKTILIGIDSNGTRVIGSSDDPLFKTEVVNFLRRFFGLLYNFDGETFESNVGSASDLMSLELWNREKEKILKLGTHVKTEKISHTGVVKSISRLPDGSYRVVLQTSEMHRLKNTDRNLIILLSLKPIERTTHNPWGMEVSSLEETKL